MNPKLSAAGPASLGPALLRPMNALSRFIDRIATWKILIPLLALYISFPAYWLKNAEATINRLAGKPLGPIDLTFGFDPARTLRMVADYGPAARAYYTLIELTTDLVYPIVYSLLWAVVLTLLFRGKAYKPFGWIALLPFISLLFDYLENATIVGLLTTYPNQSVALAVLCELFKLAKWLTFGGVISLVLYGLVRLMVTQWRTSSQG
ncbi:hypothetical protein GCM10027275_27220 [Rhabdobacter roseus]|uniref:Uncharacterized protein n=1 Tax=Rhabdobacter roseus TaxID=1655419 RepID=A0A840TWT1_9BACT|nr:hypothetical protein [Rhabdobacter roseus]MBB5284668.1 hypothetical protein [Rhabdobacter roseus]